MIALVRTEMTKAVRRARTLVILLGLVALPTVIAFAIHARGERREADNAVGLFRLARTSGLVVPAALLAVMSGFLLIVVAGTFAGDSVAGDAATGNLRYLLMRPVRRGRLLVAKAVVAGSLIAACTALVVVTGLVAGVVLFGWHPVTVPAIPGLLAQARPGFTLTTGDLLVRVAIATGYVAVGYLALLGLGTFFSVLTDTAAGAIGATVGVYIVAEILDGISELGRVRYLFPTHYLSSWTTMFTENQFSRDLVAGVVVQVAYLVVFGGLALWWFGRKDIRS